VILERKEVKMSDKLSLTELGKRIIGHLDVLRERFVSLRSKLATVEETQQSTVQQLKALQAQLNQLHEKRQREAHAEKDLQDAKVRLKNFEDFSEAFAKLMGPMAADAARKIVRSELARIENHASIEKEKQSFFNEDAARQIVKEELAKLASSQPSSAGQSIAIEQVREEIRKELDVKVRAMPNVVMVQPKEHLLKSVLAKEVESVKSAVEKLPAQTRLMLGYLATSTKPVKFKDLMIRYVGSDGGSQREQYLYPLRSIPSMVDYDSSHGLVRYVWRERMKEAYSDLGDEELDAAMDQVHALLATNVA
jgi:hypothetical protein